MNAQDLIKDLKKSSKLNDIPGTVEVILESQCPICLRTLRKYKACCGNPNGYDGCVCGYKERR